jgi:hypothetical protein
LPKLGGFALFSTDPTAFCGVKADGKLWTNSKPTKSDPKAHPGDQPIQFVKLKAAKTGYTCLGVFVWVSDDFGGNPSDETTGGMWSKLAAVRDDLLVDGQFDSQVWTDHDSPIKGGIALWSGKTASAGGTVPRACTAITGSNSKHVYSQDPSAQGNVSTPANPPQALQANVRPWPSTPFLAGTEIAGVFASGLSGGHRLATNFEPSGAAPMGGWMYVASDDGKIGRCRVGETGRNLSYAENFKSSDKASGFEALTPIPGRPGYLYAGLEGADGVPLPRLFEFQIEEPEPEPGKPPATEPWSLTLKRWWTLHLDKHTYGGMEGLAFVPDAYTARNPSTGGFGGLFFAAGQRAKGKLVAFDVPDSTSPPTGPVEPSGEAVDLPCDVGKGTISDLAFVPGASASGPAQLYVLFDDDDPNLPRMLLEIALPAKQVPQDPWRFVQGVVPPCTGVEAVALAGSWLYLGIDQSPGQARRNGTCIQPAVDDCSDFYNYLLLYPLTDFGGGTA